MGSDGYVQSPLTPDNASKPGKTRRIPFIPSIKSRRAAQKAYLEHLRSELETTQRQLYTSHNTCRTLRKRFEDHRKESFAMLARIGGTSSDSNSIDEVELQRITENEDQIEQLKRKLDSETQKRERQIEQIKILQLELKDMTTLKEEMEQHQYQAQTDKEILNESHERIRKYEEEVALLRLKLEAADVASKRRHEQQSVTSDGGQTWKRRGDELKAELASVRSKYFKLVVKNLGFSDFSSNSEIDEIGEQMDETIQMIIQSSLEAVEQGWQQKFEILQSQLSNITDYAALLQEEKDLALKRMNDALSTSPDTQQSEESANASEQQLLREELRRELTDAITEQLTEKLKENVTMQLTNEFEKNYRKKYAELQKQQSQQEDRNKNFISEKILNQEELDERQNELIHVEVEKVKQQYESEYEMKFEELKQKSEEQIQFQKERMRKLVRALLVREAKQKQMVRSKLKTLKDDDHRRVEQTSGESEMKYRAKAKKKKKQKRVDSDRIESEIVDADSKYDHLSTTVSPNSASSRIKTRSPPGVVSKI